MKRFSRLLLLFPLTVLLLCAAFATPARAAGRTATAWADFSSAGQNSLSRAYASTGTSAAAFQTVFGAADRSYGDSLKNTGADETGAAWMIYQALIEQTAQGSYTVAVTPSTGMTSDALMQAAEGAYQAWTLDCPVESAPCTGEVSAEFTFLLDGTVTSASFTLGTYSFVSGVTALRSAVSAFAEQFQSEAAGLATLDQYRYIHDYLCKICSYNDDAANNPGKYDDETRKQIHSAYGVFIDDGTGNGSVVCEGYASAFTALCHAVGLPCLGVAGEAESSGTFSGTANHIWNYILVDGSWYAVDSTWDDLSLSSSGIEYQLWYYCCFGNNSDFTGAAGARHNPIVLYPYSDCSWTLSIPALSADTLDVSQWLCGHMAVSGTSDLTSAVSSVQSGTFSVGSQQIVLRNIPAVTFSCPTNAVLSAVCTVPAGVSYSFAGTDGSTLSRSSGYTGILFSVQPGGALSLSSLSVTGSTSSSPLISCSAGDSFADLSLTDVSITGNTGAFAVVSDSTVRFAGRCIVNGSTKSGADANLEMEDGCMIWLSSHLSTGSAIHLAKDTAGLCIQFCDGFTPSDVDKSCFTADDAAKPIYWLTDGGYSGLLQHSTGTGEPLTVTYPVLPPASLSGQTVTFSNNTSSALSATAYLAFYQGGKMLSVLSISITVPAGSTLSITLPAPPSSVLQSADTAKLFTWSPGILSEVVTWSAE